MITIVESLYKLSNTLQVPWLVEGDFNIISNEKEILRGLPIIEAKVKDCNYCITGGQRVSREVSTHGIMVELMKNVYLKVLYNGFLQLSFQS